MTFYMWTGNNRFIMNGLKDSISIGGGEFVAMSIHQAPHTHLIVAASARFSASGSTVPSIAAAGECPPLLHTLALC